MKFDKTKSYQNISLCRKKSYNKRYTNSRTFIEKQDSDSSASLQDVWTNTLCLIDHQRVAVNKNFSFPRGTNLWNFLCLLTYIKWWLSDMTSKSVRKIPNNFLRRLMIAKISWEKGIWYWFWITFDSKKWFVFLYLPAVYRSLLF